MALHLLDTRPCDLMSRRSVSLQKRTTNCVSMGTLAVKVHRQPKCCKALSHRVAAGALLALISYTCLATHNGFIEGRSTLANAPRAQLVRHASGPQDSDGHNSAPGGALVGSGVTDLMDAAHAGNTAGINGALQAGCDIDARDDYGWTAIRYAVRNSHYDAAAVLLEAGANVNLASKSGRTPLMSAASNTLDTLCELLVREGADITAKDDSGRTAHDLSLRGGSSGSEFIRELLAKAEASDVTSVQESDSFDTQDAAKPSRKIRPVDTGA